MWYEDLSECDYLKRYFSVNLTAIGWLEKGKPYNTGKIQNEVYQNLCQFNRTPYCFTVACGFHYCGYCKKIDEPWGSSDKWGKANLTIPYKYKLYHYPEMITHYIKEHSYLPPEEFCEAVLACPPMSSMDYYNKMVENGGKIIVKGNKEKFS